MKKTIKKIAAAVMAVATLNVGMVGMSASAVSETVSFMRDAGSPSSADTTCSISPKCEICTNSTHGICAMIQTYLKFRLFPS